MPIPKTDNISIAIKSINVSMLPNFLRRYGASRREHMLKREPKIKNKFIFPSPAT